MALTDQQKELARKAAPTTFSKTETRTIIDAIDTVFSLHTSLITIDGADFRAALVALDASLSAAVSDTDTLGRLLLFLHDAVTHLPVWHEYMVLPANVYDSLFSTDKLQVDLTQWIGTAPLALTSQLVRTQADQLDTQAKADVNAEVDSALDTAIPGSPASDSVNERLAAVDDKKHIEFAFSVSTTNVGQITAHMEQNGVVINATTVTIVVEDYDGTVVITNAEWDVGPSEDTGDNTWYAEKTDVSSDLSDGKVYKVVVTMDTVTRIKYFATAPSS